MYNKNNLIITRTSMTWAKTILNRIKLFNSTLEEISHSKSCNNHKTNSFIKNNYSTLKNLLELYKNQGNYNIKVYRLTLYFLNIISAIIITLEPIMLFEFLDNFLKIDLKEYKFQDIEILRCVFNGCIDLIGIKI